MKLLTRRQIIDIWLKQTVKNLDSYCCPNCRDILQENKTHFWCGNGGCAEEVPYDKKEMSIGCGCVKFGERKFDYSNATFDIENGWEGVKECKCEKKENKKDETM
jgi:hypothetical protein